jgi:hypothetical protein
MSGKISDNLGTASGLVKSATDAPDSGSSNPTVSTNPSAAGDRFINTTSGELFVCIDATAGSNKWRGQLGTEIDPPTPSTGGRGLFGGGISGNSDVIDYITIATTGDATDFGNLTVGRGEGGSCSNGSRALWGGGGGDSTGKDEIDYVTISSTGNATDFGNLSSVRNGVTACSDGTKGLFWLGGQHPTYVQTIEYVNITSTGNVTDFGDMLETPQKLGAAVCDGSRAVHAGGRKDDSGSTSGSSTIEYINTSSTGNATDFGELNEARAALAGVTDNTKGVFGGGYLVSSYTNTLQYVNVNSVGNASDFGDMTSGSAWVGACSNASRGVWNHGYDPSTGSKNILDYLTIASLGNSSDFGDATITNYGRSGCAGD